jgi:hypothetical protein
LFIAVSLKYGSGQRPSRVFVSLVSQRVSPPPSPRASLQVSLQVSLPVSPLAWPLRAG